MTIVTEVAGRVCEIAVKAGDAVNAGDTVLLIEAMKMEIPVAATAAGRVASILVKIDDMVGEEQPVAVVAT